LRQEGINEKSGQDETASWSFGAERREKDGNLSLCKKCQSEKKREKKEEIAVDLNEEN